MINPDVNNILLFKKHDEFNSCNVTYLSRRLSKAVPDSKCYGAYARERWAARAVSSLYFEAFFDARWHTWSF